MGSGTQHRLSSYRRKRDFAVTPEPTPERVRRKRNRALEFVVQKHDATRLHYDVRLEIDGAMMSFAVPKGPSYDPAVKRLAIETEDHPMAYNAFEGRIPEGEYGAGDVLVWDRGTYETIPPGVEAAQRAKGHLHVRFHGDKLVGDWHFVRTRRHDAPSERPQWLMLKGTAERADPTLDVVASSPESVRSGRVATRGPSRGRRERGGPKLDAATLPEPPPQAAKAVAPMARALHGAVRLSNPDKVLFPADGITKRDLAEYYAAVAPVLLPHLAGRPVSLQRWPNGIREPAWYQQDAPPKSPAFVRLVPIEDRRQIVVENAETLRWLANLAALTIHQFGGHLPADATTKEQVRAAIATPDYVIFDLDPGNGPWAHLVEVARALRVLLDGLELESAVKTSGKRGVHVVVPIAPGHGHDEVRGFAEKLARAVAKFLPRIATVERMKTKRGGRLYVDCLQNGEGKTIVAPYSVRALDGAPVSTPIRWSELDDALDPSTFTIRTVLRRIERHGDLFAGALAGKHRLPAL